MSSSSSRLNQFRSSKLLLYPVAYLTIFADTYLQSLIVPILPFALTDILNLNPQDVQKWTGILIGLYGAGYIVGSPVAGYIADRSAARRLPLAFGLVTLVLSTVMFALGRTIPVLVVARLILGISSGFTHSIGTALLADTVGDGKSGKAMGFLNLTIASGFVVGPIAGGALYHHFGYSVPFVSAYALMGLVALLLIPMKERVPGTSASKSRETDNGYGTMESNTQSRDAQEPLLPSNAGERQPRRPNLPIILGRPRMQVAMFSGFMSDVFFTEITSTLPLRMKTLFHFNPQSVGLVLLFLLVANFAAPWVGVLTDRVGARIVITAGFVLMTPMWILMRLVDHDSQGQLILLYALLFCIGMGQNLVISPVFTEAKLVVDEIDAETPGLFGKKRPYATSFALMNMSYAAGALVGPVLGTILMDRVGWKHTTMIFGIWSAVCVAPVLYRGGTIVRRPGDESRTDDASTRSEP